MILAWSASPRLQSPCPLGFRLSPGELRAYLSVPCLLVFVFPFLASESTPNLALGRFRCLQTSWLHTVYPEACEAPTRRLVSWTRLHHPRLVFCSANYCIRYSCLPPHVRIPQASMGRTSGSLPSRVNGSPPPCGTRDKPRVAPPA